MMLKALLIAATPFLGTPSAGDGYFVKTTNILTVSDALVTQTAKGAWLLCGKASSEREAMAALGRFYWRGKPQDFCRKHAP